MIKVIANDIKTISISVAVETNEHKDFIIQDKKGDIFFLVKTYDKYFLVKHENYYISKTFNLCSLDKVLTELLSVGYNIYIRGN